MEDADKALASLQRKTVLVEGKNDVAALKQLGVDADFVTATGRNEDVVRKAAKGQIVLLFDFDGEGRRKEKFFRELLHNEGLSVLDAPRRKIRRAFGTLTIEELPARYEKMIEEKRDD